MDDKQFKCNSFVFYASFYEAIRVLPLDSQARIYDAIFKFAFENVEAELDGVDLAVFLLVKPQILANRVKYENGCKGGAPKGNQNARKKTTENQPTNNQDTTKTQPKNKQRQTEIQPTDKQKQPNENDNDNVNENEHYLSLLKILKNKMTTAGVYTGVHDKLVDEVLETLARACIGTHSRKYNGKMCKPTDFETVADNLKANKLCFIVNRLLQHADEIDSRPQYILSLLTCEK